MKYSILPIWLLIPVIVVGILILFIDVDDKSISSYYGEKL
jgi:hypothetical protein